MLTGGVRENARILREERIWNKMRLCTCTRSEYQRKQGHFSRFEAIHIRPWDDSEFFAFIFNYLPVFRPYAYWG
jgi:hypothetical protein